MLDLTESTDSTDIYEITGTIRTPYDERRIKNVMVFAKYDNGIIDTFITSEDGEYRFEVSKGATLTIEPEKKHNQIMALI